MTMKPSRQLAARKDRRRLSRPVLANNHGQSGLALSKARISNQGVFGQFDKQIIRDRRRRGASTASASAVECQCGDPAKESTAAAIRRRKSTPRVPKLYSWANKSSTDAADFARPRRCLCRRLWPTTFAFRLCAGGGALHQRLSCCYDYAERVSKSASSPPASFIRQPIALIARDKRSAILFCFAKPPPPRRGHLAGSEFRAESTGGNDSLLRCRRDEFTHFIRFSRRSSAKTQMQAASACKIRASRRYRLCDA